MTVTMILSENVVEVTSVSTPSIVPADCLVIAGYVACVLGTWLKSVAMGTGMVANRITAALTW